MKAWLRDRPWIWIALFLAFLLASGAATLIIAELNHPIIIPH